MYHTQYLLIFFLLLFRFYDRISKTYRNENWNVLLTDILKSIVKCSKETHSYQILIESLVELLSGGIFKLL